jgi:DNA-binding SARP family transcriptional activator
MEALWPDEEAEALPNRLSVALTALRTGLDPERQFASGYFLVADRHSVRLDLEHVTVDVESFLAAASTGLRLLDQRSAEAATTLEAAERLYTGDFLEEDVYEEWAVSLREEARVAYVAVARGLAETSAEAGEHDGAVRYQLRILERDRYDERAHLGLVTALARGGRHGEAHRQYRRYVTLMEEIEVEPAPVPR